MAAKNYKIDEAIPVIYQAAGAATGLDVEMQVYDEANTAFTTTVQAMAETSAVGRYLASFTPDAVGDWFCTIADSGGGKAIKQFSVGAYNVDSIGGAVGTMDNKVVAVQTAVDAVDVRAIAIHTAVNGIDSKIVAVQTAIDVIRANVSAINIELDGFLSPPMVG